MLDKSTTNSNAPARRSGIAITGATGFVGRALLSRLADLDRPISALCRGGMMRGNGICDRVRWIAGDIDDTDACDAMLEGASTVLHLAGLTKALDPQSFYQINAVAAGRLARQAREAGVEHFILLSSLAATRPEVSDYAASKAAGEVAVLNEAGDMPVTIIRAPAVLGQGDRATQQLFASLAKGIVTVPGGSARNSRFSTIDVGDLAQFLADVATMPHATPGTLTPCGVQYVDFDLLAATAAEITGQRVRRITLPRPLISLAGRLADVAAKINHKPEVFSSHKVREIYAGDWIAETVVSSPTPLSTTLRDCLAPYIGSNAGQQSRAS